MQKLLIVLICNLFFSYFSSSQSLIDKDASPLTVRLFENLKSVSSDRIMFGHQDGLAYGVEWEKWHQKKSDVKDVCGNYPAVFGWELSKLGQRPYNIDTVNFKHIQDWMKEVYKMGALNTVSWHMDNFVNGKSSWDVGDQVVTTLLPAGENHEAYKAKLDLFADYMNEIKVGFLFKKKVPFVFRPFHEHTGGWFWWGAKWCSAEDYKSLWRFTVEYLRDVKGMHQVIWAYSPDVVRDTNHYLEYYPGDDYVDILGLDDYHDVGLHGNIEDLTRRLKLVVELAEERGKIAALTETGFEAIPMENWWTEKLLDALKDDPAIQKLSWIMVWRNDRKDHHYAPYPGHISANNFVEFSQDPLMLFQNELPNLYKKN